MPELSFKTNAYKRYSPWLYRITKLKAKCLFKLDYDQPEDMYNMLWDRYLAEKHLQEAWQVGGTPNNKIKWKKSSNTLFILGCGSSINDVTNQQWQKISEHDSIGVNYFYFHDFIPDAHFIELGGSIEAANAVHSFLLNNPLRTETVFMQIRHLLKNDVQLKCVPQRVNLYSPTTMKSRNVNILRDYLARYYKPLSEKQPLIHHSSTLDCVINFGVRQGYKKLCLVGVDLNKNTYFWDENPSLPKYQIAIETVNADYDKAKWIRDGSVQHATVNKSLNERLNCLDLMSYLSLLKETEFKRYGTELVVANSKSLLTSLFSYQSISDAAETGI